ncbi:hypothetical protein ACVMII_000793 [Bradyrhizobium diazoefficiens]
MPKRHHENITMNGIHIEDDRMPLDEEHVKLLAASIKEIGLIEPIVVCRRYHRTPTLVLVAGRHRLEAHKRLKLQTIAAIVEEEDSPAVDRWRKLAEIDENLIRRHLTAAQRAKLVARRKALYEAVHPQTKHGGDRKSTNAKNQDAEFASRSFAADTATKTGKSKRSVEVDAARAKALGDDLDRVAGTSLDKGTELDALAKMSREERAPLIEQAAAGEQVSAVHSADVSAGDGNGRMTVTIGNEWREGLPKSADYIGVPEGEFASFLMELGLRTFNRALRLSPRMNKDGNVAFPEMPNTIAWWLIEMHSKYPDTFNVGSWEGSCGYLAIDKLYAARGVPIGKYREWQQAERNKGREAKRDTASAPATAAPVSDELDIPACLRRT